MKLNWKLLINRGIKFTYKKGIKLMEIVWKNHVIKKVVLNEEQINEVYSFGKLVQRLVENEKLGELTTLQDGYYEIVGLNQFFSIETIELSDLNKKWRELHLPYSKENVINTYLNQLAEREYQEEEGEILAEIAVFNSDMDTPLEFMDGVAKMKNYYRKTIELKNLNEDYYCNLYLNGKYEIEIYFNEDMKKYSAYDGVEGYGWHDTIKQAVKFYMDSCYRYKNSFDGDYTEPSCSSCGDGGCPHCESHRFI